MNSKQDIYNHEEKFKSLISKIELWDISNKNKEFIRRFIDLCGAENMSLVRRIRYIQFLKIISKLLVVDFDKATKDDIIGLVGKLNSMNYAPNTKKDFKVTIKKFYSTLFYESRKEFVDWMYEKRNQILKDIKKL